ncbi:Flp family type IVb pilin [Oricola thermophila]|uniref:Flp family type IVb pilin n=1 Tax=Oricola thermophila TaxID=2742145 RepID=A0A6N1VLD5_9HYPH|nr:Flp family type IVb pilin [Oricola thermophila]QKV20212.1 Flp family type IVb pilin [Oricola thermophila]
MLNSFIADETGATAVEYGIIATVLSVVIVGSIGFALEAVRWLWSDNNSEITKSLN